MTGFRESAQRRVSKVGRYWRCLTKPDKYSCSAEERKKAHQWLFNSYTAVLVSLLFAAGIIITAVEVTQMKKDIKEREEAMKIQVAQKLAYQHEKYQTQWTKLKAAFEKPKTDDQLAQLKTDFDTLKTELAQLENIINTNYDKLMTLPNTKTDIDKIRKLKEEVDKGYRK